MMHDLSAEKRQSARTACDALIAAQPIPQTIATDRWHWLAQDISERGMRLTAEDCVPVGSRVLMSVDAELPAEPIRLVGTVVWVSQLPYQNRWSVGVEFADLAGHAQTPLRGLTRLH